MKLNLMACVSLLGNAHDAPITEIAFVMFDPFTGEVSKSDSENTFHRQLDIREALRHGRTTVPQLQSYMLARRHDMLIFNNPTHMAKMADVGRDLRKYIDGLCERRGVKWEDISVYNDYPAYQLPSLIALDEVLNAPERALWPTYGVVCSKTLKDLARPQLVKHAVGLPVRQPSRDGLLAEAQHEALVVSHSVQMLHGEHPALKPPVKPTKGAAKAAVKSIDDCDEDDEL